MVCKRYERKTCNSWFSSVKMDINAAYKEMAGSMTYYLSSPAYNKIELEVRRATEFI